MKKIFQICLVGLSVVGSQIAIAQSNQVLPIPAPIQAEMQGKANNNLQIAVYENIGEQKAKPSFSNFDAPPCVSCQHEIQDYQKQLDGVRKDMARYDQATQAKFTSVIAELEARIAEMQSKLAYEKEKKSENLMTEKKLSEPVDTGKPYAFPAAIAPQ